MEDILQCPVCGNTYFKPFLVCKDYLVSKKEFSIQECQKCTFRLTNPRPDNSSIGSYYKSDQYVSHNDSKGGLINTAYRTVRSYTLRSKLNLINELNGRPGRLLDIGCGTGTFLETCRQGEWAIAGIEPDDDARAVASNRLQVAIKSNLDELTDNHFDIVTLWHVLEHISDLNEVISQIRSLLNNKGTVLIAVPNSDSYDARYFKQYWAAYDVPRHLYHFTPATIKQLFTRHGFTLAQQKPMIFDAFYIAMLSTKYQTGTTNYLESVKIGLKSNSEARRTGNSSSLIYLFSKS